VALLGAVLLVVAPWSSGDDQLPVHQSVRSYHVAYEVTDESSDQPVVSNEEIWVRRPFEGRKFSHNGDTGIEITSVVNRFLYGSISSSDLVPLTAVTQLNPPTGDLRVAHALDALVDKGRLEVGGTREVLGRSCVVIRSKSPLSGGIAQPPADDESTDACLDEHGIVLSERWQLNGKVLRDAIATKVEIDVDLDDALFVVGGDPLPIGQGGSIVSEVTRNSRPWNDYWETDAEPNGYRFVGRFVFLRTDPSAAGSSLTGTVPLQVMADLYRKGADWIVIEQGAASALPLPDGVQVDVGDMGRGLFAADVGANILAVRIDALKNLYIRGPVPEGDLLAFAKRLRPKPEHTLTTAGPPLGRDPEATESTTTTEAPAP
jgi:hypothetical protein